MDLITPQLKDALLRELVSYNELKIFVQSELLAKKLSTSQDVVVELLNYFVRKNLCAITHDYIGGKFDIVLNTEAYDMVQRGGFVAQEEVLKQELEKLALEIQELQPKTSEQAQRITAIFSNIATFFHLALKFKFCD